MDRHTDVWDFWLLVKRPIIADDLETARKRLYLTEYEEVICVGDRPVFPDWSKSPSFSQASEAVIEFNDPPPFDLTPTIDLIDYEDGPGWSAIRAIKSAFHLANKRRRSSPTKNKSGRSLETVRIGDVLRLPDGREGRVGATHCGDPACKIEPFHVRLDCLFPDRQVEGDRIVWADLRDCQRLVIWDD